MSDDIVHSSGCGKTGGDFSNRPSDTETTNSTDKPTPNTGCWTTGPERVEEGDGDGTHQTGDGQGEGVCGKKAVVSTELLLVAEFGQPLGVILILGGGSVVGQHRVDGKCVVGLQLCRHGVAGGEETEVE